MFDNPQDIKDELYDFAENYKDVVGGMDYIRTRFIHAQKNYGMKLFNMNDYFEMRYSLEHLEPGNAIKWDSVKTVNIHVEFINDMWISFMFSGLTWNADDLPMIDKLIKEKDLSLNEREKAFFIDGVFMYDIDLAKELIMVIDKQLNEYVHVDI